MRLEGCFQSMLSYAPRLIALRCAAQLLPVISLITSTSYIPPASMSIHGTTLCKLAQEVVGC